MSEPRRVSYAPWITAAIAGAVLLALLLVYFLALRPDEGKINGGLTGQERSAMLAASGEAVNSLSYRRASFDADWQRAYAGATGHFASDLKSQKSNTLKAMTDGKFDLSAKVQRVALGDRIDSGTHHGYVVLVTMYGYKSNAPSAPKYSQLAVTVESVNGKWLVSNIESVGDNQ
jgi:hypothetical protein